MNVGDPEFSQRGVEYFGTSRKVSRTKRRDSGSQKVHSTVEVG